MKKITQFLPSGKSRHAGRRKTRAQSLVEFAITLPVLLLLFSGLVEFGFALNFYLSLLDATREAARYASNWDPFLRDPNDSTIIIGDDMTFYNNTVDRTLKYLDPQVEFADYQGRRIVLDAATDDILVTVFSWSDADGVERYPTSGTITLNHVRTSRFTDEDIASRFEPGSPHAGLVLVEVHYNYHQRLAIPFFTDFVPNPIFMRAYTIMPLSAIQEETETSP
jgi:hypothetical protein